MRQLRPAALAGEQERGLAFLPLDGARRAEEIELHRRLVGIEIRHAVRRACASSASCSRRVLRAHRRRTADAPTGSRPGSSHGASRLTRAACSFEHSEAEALLDARQLRDRVAHLGDPLVGARRNHEAEMERAASSRRLARFCTRQAGAPHEALDAALEPGMRLADRAQVVAPRRAAAGVDRAARPASPAAPASRPSCPARDR